MSPATPARDGRGASRRPRASQPRRPTAAAATTTTNGTSRSGGWQLPRGDKRRAALRPWRGEGGRGRVDARGGHPVRAGAGEGRPSGEGDDGSAARAGAVIPRGGGGSGNDSEGGGKNNGPPAPAEPKDEPTGPAPEGTRHRRGDGPCRCSDARRAGQAGRAGRMTIKTGGGHSGGRGSGACSSAGALKSPGGHAGKE